MFRPTSDKGITKHILTEVLTRVLKHLKPCAIHAKFCVELNSEYDTLLFHTQEAIIKLQKYI